MCFKVCLIKKQFTLSKSERLKSRKLIDQLFKDGRSFAVFPFRVYYLSTEGKKILLQAGFGVSGKNFKKAVDRNRIKRLTKEAYRLKKAELFSILKEKNIHFDLFFIFTAKELPEQARIEQAIGVTLQRLIKIVNEIGSSPV